MGEWTLENILGIQRGTYRPELEQKQGEFSFLDKQYQELGTHSYVQDVLSTKKKLASAEAGSHRVYSVQGWFPYGAESNVRKAKMYREELSELFKSKDRPVYEQYVQTEKQRSAAKQRIRELQQIEREENLETSISSEKVSNESVEGIVKQYNKKVDEYNKLKSSEKSSEKGKALKNVTEKLGGRIDYYAQIYNKYDTPQLGNVKRSFKDVRIAERTFTAQKNAKLAQIAAIKDPVEKRLVMERDLPYFEGTEKQLKSFKKLVNIDTKNQLEEMGSGNQGIIGAPEAPAMTPTGTSRVPFSQNMPFNEAPSLPKDPMSGFENYFKGNNNYNFNKKGNDYGFNTKGMYGVGKSKGRNSLFGW